MVASITHAKAYADAKEKMNTLRAEKMKERFEFEQKKKQDMIDRAIEQLKQLKDTENARLASQAAELRAKEDARMEAKRQARANAWDAIVRSRTMQMDIRKQRAKEQRDQVRILRGSSLPRSDISLASCLMGEDSFMALLWNKDRTIKPTKNPIRDN